MVKGSYLFSLARSISVFILAPRLERHREGRVYLKTQKARLSLSSAPPPHRHPRLPPPLLQPLPLF